MCPEVWEAVAHMVDNPEHSIALRQVAMEGYARVVDWSAVREAGGLKFHLRLLPPDDRVGLRHRLFAWLLTVGDEEALNDLVGRLGEEPSTFWQYSLVLSRYRRIPSEEEATSLAYRKAIKAADLTLRVALWHNRHVPAALENWKTSDSERDRRMGGPGSPEEAEVYAELAAEAWRATPGALDWLRERAAAGVKDQRSSFRSPQR